MNNLADKLLTTGISLAGGYIGTKVVEAGWKAFTGEDAPKDVDDADQSLVRAVVFATITAGISALIRVASQRGAAKAIVTFQDRRAAKLGRLEV
ncbi:DUF4235 domain-containing protein [Citricoccus sp. NR2]|uniref:DUF4235 domain-containing protein n=1 Tax=Citricoccus sp. NR2 TaxID=3004095 RepID=UPI0022DDE21B|nr:DUF4235 domain-containing protein [Citricoccus sp. NR2]WBL20391.1 DUF4235 domain-containing protein [Citricoccus sp. NR2]